MRTFPSLMSPERIDSFLMSSEPIRAPATAVPVEPTATRAAAMPAMARVLRLMKRMCGVSFCRIPREARLLTKR